MERKKKRIGLISLLIVIALLYFFNFKSNIHMLLDNSGKAYNYEIENQKVLTNSPNVLIRQINLRRQNSTIFKKIISKISRPKLYYIEFKKNRSNFSVAYYKSGSTANKNIKDTTIFSINSSFYNSSFNPSGLITVKGKEYGKTSISSGHFKVINGKAKAGPTSVFNKNERVDYSCQSHPSVMKNGVIWDYIIKESMNEKYWKYRTYRSLVGQNQKGHVCFLVSGNGGLLSIKEIALIAKSNNIHTATCLDAGSALQYALRDEGFKLSFSSMNNKLSLGRSFDKVTSKVFGKRFYNESPAYINFQRDIVVENR